MTAHFHDPATHGLETAPVVRTAVRRSTTFTRPRWLMPGAMVAMAVGALVMAGVLPLSIVLYAALFGGCALMHVVGHGGHGGGGEAGRGHSLHGADADDEEDLSHRSSGAQPGPARSTAEFDPRTLDDTTPMSETEDHDQRAHGCH